MTRYLPPIDAYGILAAPPCTQFSLARRDTTSKTPRNLREGMEVVEACLRIIWQCQMESKGLKFWAIENPVGYLRRFIGRPPLTFEPWWYGDLHTKRTDIWGSYSLPQRVVFEKPAMVQSSGVGALRWRKPVAPPEYSHLKLGRPAIRAITPQGFASAFFEQIHSSLPI